MIGQIFLTCLIEESATKIHITLWVDKFFGHSWLKYLPLIYILSWDWMNFLDLLDCTRIINKRCILNSTSRLNEATARRWALLSFSELQDLWVCWVQCWKLQEFILFILIFCVVILKYNRMQLRIKIMYKLHEFSPCNQFL